MSKGSDFEECYCECHTNPDYHHITSCCLKCPICKKHITKSCFNGHIEKCRSKYEKEMKEWKMT